MLESHKILKQIDALKTITNTRIKRHEGELARLNAEKRALLVKIQAQEQHILTLQADKMSFKTHYYKELTKKPFSSGDLIFFDKKVDEYDSLITEGRKKKEKLTEDVKTVEGKIREEMILLKKFVVKNEKLDFLKQ